MPKKKTLFVRDFAPVVNLSFIPRKFSKNITGSFKYIYKKSKKIFIKNLKNKNLGKPKFNVKLVK